MSEKTVWAIKNPAAPGCEGGRQDCGEWRRG